MKGIGAAIMTLALAACGNDANIVMEMMQTPAFLINNKTVEHSNDPFEAQRHGMLYVTDREPVTKQDYQNFYSNKRGSVIRVGKAEVGHQLKGNQKVTKFSGPDEIRKVLEAPMKVHRVRELGYLNGAKPFGFLTDQNDLKGTQAADDDFVKAINKKLSTSKQKDIFLFIHGYKVPFENPILVGSELWKFMQNDGVFISYCWPATPKTWAYFKDIETAELSGNNLRRVIQLLSKRTKAQRIHLIAHSAGTRVTLTALQQLTLSNKNSKKVNPHRIGNVALVASDYDVQKFATSIMDGLLANLDELNVYVSDADSALGFSKLFLRQQRLGQVGDAGIDNPAVRDWVTHSKKVFFINVSGAPLSAKGIGHSYFRKSPWVSSDLILSIKEGLKPDKRALYRPADKLHWSFPKDYEQRVRALK